MDLHQQLREIFQSLGLEFTPLEDPDTAHIFARLTGDCFKPGMAWLKSDAELCNVSMTVGPLQVVDGNRLAVELLKLNFKYPFGRISAVDIHNDAKSLFVVCETMFSVRDPDDRIKAEVRSRMHNLASLRSAAEAIMDVSHS